MTDPEITKWAQTAADAFDPWKYIYALVEEGLLVTARPGVKGLRWVYAGKRPGP